MNEFEKEILSFMKSVDKRLSEIESNISEMKEDLEITRVSANYNGEKLEELTNELKAINIISK